MNTSSPTPVDTIVRHPTFGQGIVVSSSDEEVQVYFRGRQETRRFRPPLPLWLRSQQRTADTVGEARVEIDLPIVTASSFADREVPERKFLDARHLFPMNNVTLLSGDGGTGKSLLVMQLATAVASAKRWLGQDVRAGTVLYFSAEDDEAETHIRLSEVCAAEGIDLASLDALGISVMAGQDAVLAVENSRMSALQATPLWKALTNAVHANSPVLLVLDNLADVFSGNENSKPLVRQFIGMLRGLAISEKCAIVLLSHPSVAGMNSGTGTSGNTAWNNSVRSRLYLRRVLERDGDSITESDPDLRTLTTMKANYGPSGAEVRVRWEAGRFVAVDETRSDAGDPIAQATKAERVFMHLLRWHLRHSIYVSPNKSRSWAPSVFAAHSQAEGVKAKQFEVAMTILLEHRRIEVYTHGSMARRRQHIGLPIGADIDDE